MAEGTIVPTDDHPNDRAVALPQERFDYKQLMDVESGAVLRGGNLSLMKWVGTHPHSTIWSHTINGFKEGMVVGFTEYIYLDPGEVYKRTYDGGEARIMACLVYEPNSQGNLTIQTSTLGMNELSLDIEATPENGTQAFIMILINKPGLLTIRSKSSKKQKTDHNNGNISSRSLHTENSLEEPIVSYQSVSGNGPSYNWCHNNDSPIVEQPRAQYTDVHNQLIESPEHGNSCCCQCF